jgi:exodeoxyribonuclease VII small subunit
MKLYERGQALVKRCAVILDKAELKVKQLTGDTLADLEEAE